MSSNPHGLSRYDQLVREKCLAPEATVTSILPQVFGYLLEANPVTGIFTDDELVDKFETYVDTLTVDEAANGKADAGMTFFGQFIDHDITLDATSAIGRRIDPRQIRNVRTPNLDLDCVYGDGPEATPHLYSKLHEHFLLFGREDNPNDLARNFDGTALIGDPRNDENIIISQIQGAFICLHNILMGHAEGGSGTHQDVKACAEMNVRSVVWHSVLPEKLVDFESVRRFIRLHYQWIILNDFLPQFVDQDCIALALATDPFGAHAPVMPAEFSVAAYRFGHATAQNSYKLKKADKEAIDLFKMQGFRPRAHSSEMEMRMFFDVAGTKAQKARPVGMKMARQLMELPESVVPAPIKFDNVKLTLEQSRKLALRNILRDRLTLQLPHGQMVARHLGLDPLAAPSELAKQHIDKTPLWAYCLQEAEKLGNGKLTGVGGTIVASVLIRLMKLDPSSVLNTPDFKPWSGFGAKCTMGTVMQYVEKNRTGIPHREDLYSGPVRK